MRLLLFSLSVFCLLAVISAKKQIQENIDPIEAETKAHSSKKYSKEYQKAHHHGGHKHKKHQILDQPKEVDPEPKPALADVPEPEIQLQSDIVTSKKAIEEKKQKAEVEDLHLQDLTYEENLKKDKKKKKGHHHAENVEKQLKEKDQKLFADQEEKNPVEEKVIEDSFEPLKETRNESERKNKGKDKKSKDKTKNNKKKAFEKNKDKSKKSKDGKKKNNKDKKNKNNKDKKKW